MRPDEYTLCRKRVISCTRSNRYEKSGGIKTGSNAERVLIVRWWRERFFLGATLLRTLCIPCALTHIASTSTANKAGVARPQAGHAEMVGCVSTSTEMTLRTGEQRQWPPVCRPESLIVLNAYRRRSANAQGMRRAPQAVLPICDRRWARLERKRNP